MCENDQELKVTKKQNVCLFTLCIEKKRQHLACYLRFQSTTSGNAGLSRSFLSFLTELSLSEVEWLHIHSVRNAYASAVQLNPVTDVSVYPLSQPLESTLDLLRIPFFVSSHRFGSSRSSSRSMSFKNWRPMIKSIWSSSTWSCSVSSVRFSLTIQPRIVITNKTPLIHSTLAKTGWNRSMRSSILIFNSYARISLTSFHRVTSWWNWVFSF